MPEYASLGDTTQIYQAWGACPIKRKPWVTGTANNWKPLSWKHSQSERLLTNRIVCKALCKSMYEGGWVAGVLFTRLQWSLNTWNLASLNWAGQTDLWKVTHTHTKESLQLLAHHWALHWAQSLGQRTRDHCRPSCLAHFTAALTNTKQSNRTEINSEKAFLQKQEDFLPEILRKLCRNSQVAKAKE